MNKNFFHRNNCRICNGNDFVKIFDLGEMPPANSFLKKEDLSNSEEKFPLVVYFCNICKSLQLLDVVNPELLFNYYTYATSASKPLVNHFIEMTNQIRRRFLKSNNDLIIEIGGNDGSLLKSLIGDYRVLNIEPAKNIAELSRQNNIETINEFFTEELAKEIVEKYGSAKVVVANNVLAHIDNIVDVFKGIKELVKNDGVLVFEVHWVGNLISEGGFDQIYHEHLYYHSLTALKYLIEKIGLKIFDVELIPVHGQSIRVYVGNNFEISENVNKFLDREKQLGLDKAETFLAFAEKVKKNRNGLKELLINLKKEGKRIIGYGAPAKGNTLLNYFGIDNKILDFLIDTTPFKQGLYSPGSKIPIYHHDQLKRIKPDYVLLLAWNYADNILEKEKSLRENGVKFIIPVPEVKIL